jgi:hypothetical protein
VVVQLDIYYCALANNLSSRNITDISTSTVLLISAYICTLLYVHDARLGCDQKQCLSHYKSKLQTRIVGDKVAGCSLSSALAGYQDGDHSCQTVNLQATETND